LNLSRALAAMMVSACLAGAARAETHVVELSNFAVDPPALTIEASDTVEWRVASGRHSSTAKDGAWDSGEMAEGVIFAQRFDEPGVYPYFCTPHDFMRGTITVLPGPGLWARWSTWAVVGLVLALIAAGTLALRRRRA
jgi:plastocyanin